MLRQITFVPTFAGWQRAARAALLAETPPDSILWQELGQDQPLLDIGDEPEPAQPARSPIKVPKQFVEIATRVACHRDPQRWALLYRVLWRVVHGEHALLAVVVDPDVHALAQLDKAIRHDVHKMRAFVRFRSVEHAGETWYVAWFEPAHHIVELNAPFFVDRFAQMHWSILTPDRCAHWDGTTLTFTEGVPKSEAPTDDAVESLWQKYYANIFNPARVKVGAMLAEMPKRYWKNLPEAQLIPELLRNAPARVNSMMAKSRANAADFHPAPVPDSDDWAVVKKAACACTACPLYKNATQTVFGEGSAKSELVFIGEQPGDGEDLAGHPFVGPAGQLLDRALADAGIDRKRAYVTNAVKHFKWTPSGKRRIHKTPSPREVAACRPWLEAEMRIVKPKIVVCLGGTAAHSVLGPEIRVLRDRGKFVESPFCEQTFVTVHPSSLLRAPDEAAREENYKLFVADLKLVARQLKRGGD
jgi:probable DNA metabolism protein